MVIKLRRTDPVIQIVDEMPISSEDELVIRPFSSNGTVRNLPFLHHIRLFKLRLKTSIAFRELITTIYSGHLASSTSRDYLPKEVMSYSPLDSIVIDEGRSLDEIRQNFPLTVASEYVAILSASHIAVLKGMVDTLANLHGYYIYKDLLASLFPDIPPKQYTSPSVGDIGTIQIGTIQMGNLVMVSATIPISLRAQVRRERITVYDDFFDVLKVSGEAIPYGSPCRVVMVGTIEDWQRIASKRLCWVTWAEKWHESILSKLPHSIQLYPPCYFTRRCIAEADITSEQFEQSRRYYTYERRCPIYDYVNSHIGYKTALARVISRFGNVTLIESYENTIYSLKKEAGL